MIVQACINGARPKGYHPSLPLTKEAMVADAAECIASGAGELHIHPRDLDGKESLAHVDELVRGVRSACPGTLVGVSTGAWIENDINLTRDRINEWSSIPDYASVNLSESDAPAIFSLLESKGIGIEAGIATVEDAVRFVSLPQRDKVFRVLFEIEEQDLKQAQATLVDIQAVLNEAGIQRPILLHGFDATVWFFVREAREKRWSTRVGLEDGCRLEDHSIASSNAQLVASAIAIFQQKSFK
ncbi:3-keto-5-aminohexanoate cleavage protein [Roseibium sp. MMSF_3544]|uniref:3-keto-5-aminohexanoate cleavage protein n=1 Tax=unclassified Roseibium TaxID=2629323 RepID=UPI00273DDC44|nr:3-keto-5-aminohexanoate cleavage protein [Roseibium sp. MMSF_3544]